MKKVILFLFMAISSAISFAEKPFQNLPVEQKQIRCEFALDILDYTKRVRTMTDIPLPEYIPAAEYLYMNKEEAFAQYKKIADSDSENLIAQTVVGYCYIQGIGTQKNKELGKSYFSKAANKNFAPAINSLGAFADSKEEAFKFYEKSASQNYVSALYNLAYCYCDGSGCEKSLEKAEATLFKIRDLHLDDKDIYLNIAAFYKEEFNKEEKDLLPYFLLAAENGDEHAMFELWFNFYSEYKESDDSEDIGKNRAKWYRKYLETNKKDYSEKMKRDSEKLPFLLERAEKGELYAVKKLIDYYSDFSRLHTNIIKRIEWTKKAADLGDSYSCFSIAELYAKGEYIDFDFDKSVFYYDKGIKLASSEEENYKETYSINYLKDVAFSALKVNGFVNRYKKSLEEFPRSYGGYYSSDYSSVNKKTALAFCEKYSDNDKDCKLALAYYKYLNKSESAAISYLEQNGLSSAKKFFAFDEYDLNSKEYQTRQAMYLRDKKNEIEELENKIKRNPNDGRSYYELGKKYEYDDDLKSKEKTFELFKKSTECGYADSFYLLADFYEEGKLFDSDIKKAGELLKNGAELGSTSCMHRLAEMYEKGIYFDPEKGDFVQDLEKAIELFKECAEKSEYNKSEYELSKYNIKLKDDDEMYWFYHSKPKKNAKPFDWDSWTFGDFEFDELSEEDDSGKIPDYTEDEGYWENTQIVECSFAKNSKNYFRTIIESLEKGKNYRLTFAEELSSGKLSDMYDYFSKSDYAATLTLDMDLRNCTCDGYLKAHSFCGNFRNFYIPDSVVFLADSCFDIYADKFVFGSKIKNFRDPFASGKYGRLDFTLIPDEEFTSRLAYIISQLKGNYMRMVPIKANFEIILIEERHNLKIMKELRETLESNPDKRYIVDFSESAYARDPQSGKEIPLPKNFMAKQQNLYYLILGNCEDMDFPENMCRDCKNLRGIVLWDYGDAGKGAFKGVNKKCTYAERSLLENPLKEMY